MNNWDLTELRNTIKEKIIAKVKGTVSVYSIVDEQDYTLNVVVTIRNYSHTYKYTVYDLITELYSGITVDQIVNRIVNNYKDTVIKKFFKYSLDKYNRPML